jgi:biopolymer transport protein ExbD
MQRLTPERQKLDFPFAFINIILLLLFFFIVTGSIIGKNETGVAPPLTSRLTTERLPRPLLVMDKAGALFLDEVPTSLPDAIARMQRVGRDAPERTRTLNVIADRTLPAQRFLDIVEAIRRAGVPVRIVTLDAQARG